jgi:inosine-uridine nucleoside N-ribohydrolase
LRRGVALSSNSESTYISYICRKEKVQLVAMGALTNVALLLILYPEVGSMIDITLMGGALGIGRAPDAIM